MATATKDNKVKIFPSIDKAIANKLKFDAQKNMRSESSMLNLILTQHYSKQKSNGKIK